MLKELVQERLMAAADEIFALFERTIACYEEELSRTREEKERHRRLETASQTPIGLHDIEDVQQLIGHQDDYPPQLQGWITTPEQEDPQPPRIKAEEDELGITQEGECPLGSNGADLASLPLTGVSVKTEDYEEKPPESSRRYHSQSEENRGAEPPCSSLLQHRTAEMDGDHFGAPLSDSDDQGRVEVPLSSDTDCEDYVGTHADNEYHVQRLIGPQEDYPPQPQDGFTISKQEEPQPPHIKEEENELWITRKGGCPLGLKGAGLTKSPPTGVPVKTEDDEEKPPEFSQRPHSPNEENRGAEPPCSSLLHRTTEMEGDQCGASLSDRVEEPLSSGAHCEDTRTQTYNKHSKRKTVGTKWLTCSFCVKSFFKKIDFTRHMRTHTGEKPFACSVCGRRFTLKSNLAVHMRTHTGEKPFVCSVCGKAFSQKPHLRGHMGTHFRKSL
ncbi:zinc finger protein 394-like isoform X2 [Nerophis ophidion]|uniref:zinc finger protein 394-like isoform X2 n=1 Tax=Nerophis ophidion TaxID=159077 RepID=UPI002AE05A80|nr:zinc finger protein 394-like isoform X2 [Nerophis ophidion]